MICIILDKYKLKNMLSDKGYEKRENNDNVNA